jgi:hypothetical protein
MDGVPSSTFITSHTCVCFEFVLSYLCLAFALIFPLLKLFEEWIEILYNVARTRTPRNTAEKQSETENLVHKLHSSFILYLVKQI